MGDKMHSKGKLIRMGAIFLIIFLAIVSVGVYAAEQKIFIITLGYHDGGIALEEIILTKGVFRNTLSEGSYKLEVVSFDEKVIFTESFDFNLEIKFTALPEWFDENGRQVYIPSSDGLQKVLNQTTKEIIIPYFPNGKNINVYEPNGTKVLDITVAQFADVCGDKVCQDHESYESCPKDCKSGSKDDYCDSVKDKICDPDCIAKEDADCGTKPNSAKRQVLAVTLAIFAIIAAAILLIYFKSKRRDSVMQMR